MNNEVYYIISNCDFRKLSYYNYIIQSLISLSLVDISTTMSGKSDNYLWEELSFYDEESDEDIEKFSDDNPIHDLDKDIHGSSKGYCLSLSEETTDKLYEIAGTDEIERNSQMTVLPFPHVLLSIEEQKIQRAKAKLSISHDLYHFQVQSLLSLMKHENVLLHVP